MLRLAISLPYRMVNVSGVEVTEMSPTSHAIATLDDVIAVSLKELGMGRRVGTRSRNRYYRYNK
jgi:hypothetical protein